MNLKKIICLLLIGVQFYVAKAQVFPVNATTQLVPPYSVYLPDYATGINNQLRVLLLNRDMAQPDYTVKLKMTVELNGSVIMRTSDNFAAQPITIQPNEPYSVEGLQLAPYLNSNNIDFIGYGRQDYEQKKGLPEGAYRICFTAYDYRRSDNVKVSNEACSYYYLSKNDPPFVNLPACGIFILPYNGFEETLVEKAGRWLCYTLNILWTPQQRQQWLNVADGALTGTFGAGNPFTEADAQPALIDVGRAFAMNNNIEWEEIYGNAWAELVYDEFTKRLGRWNETLMVYHIQNTVINPVTGETMTNIDMETYMNLGLPGNNANTRFSWTPRHVSSPNSTLSTMYRLELFEVNPLADNAQLPAMANMAVQSTTPVFTDVTASTNYYYGPDKPALTEGKQYAWRVQAYDENGRDWFKNNGYSEVCYFTFAATPEEEMPEMEQLADFVANAENERRGRMNWTRSGPYTSYKVRYRKKGGTGNWFEVVTDSLFSRVYDLEPNTIYEAQVQGKSAAFYGPFSNLDTFKTPSPLPPPGCGMVINYASGLSQSPLTNATPYMLVKTGRFEFIVDSIGSAGGPGFYKGTGRITSVPFLAIIQVIGQMAGNEQSYGGLKVHFENIFINENREVTQGDVYAITRPLDEWLDGWDEYYEERRREEQQHRNRERFSDLDSNAVLLPVFDFEISTIGYDSATGVITLIDANGNTHTHTLSPGQRGHDIIIQGSNSEDQWVIRPPDRIIAVPGGGLYPGMNRTVSAEDIDIIKLSLQKLKADYTSIKIDQINNAWETRRNSLINYYTSIGASQGNPVENENDRMDIQVTSVNDSVTKSLDHLNAFEQKDYQFKLAQKERLIYQLVKVFASEFNTDNDYRLIGQIYRVDDINVTDFIRQKKQANLSNDAIAALIKTSYYVLFNEILQ